MIHATFEEEAVQKMTLEKVKRVLPAALITNLTEAGVVRLKWCGMTFRVASVGKGWLVERCQDGMLISDQTATELRVLLEEVE